MIYQIKIQKFERKMPSDGTVFESAAWGEVVSELRRRREDGQNVYVKFEV